MLLFSRRKYYSLSVLAIVVTILASISSCSKDESPAYPTITTTVLDINIFSNPILDMTFDEIEALGYETGDVIRLELKGIEPVDIPIVDDFLSNG